VDGDGVREPDDGDLKRHVAAGNGDRTAILFEGEPGDTATLTYAELLTQVSKAANALTELGVTARDRVAIYLPMIPEAVVAMLACARVGAAHSVVFGGFSAQALYDRITDAAAKLVITADGGYRRGSVSALKPAVDEALDRGAQQRAAHAGGPSRQERGRLDRGPRPVVGLRRRQATRHP
jgi:acetyl-CoA synthetase